LFRILSPPNLVEEEDEDGEEEEEEGEKEKEDGTEEGNDDCPNLKSD
jgi:hypothetical protein